MAFAPDDTKPGHLPPFEVAKAYAFHEALDAISRHLDTPVFELLGERSSIFIVCRFRPHESVDACMVAARGVARCRQAQPGVARSSQEQPEAARSSQGQPGAVGSSQEQSGATRSSQEQ